MLDRFSPVRPFSAPFAADDSEIAAGSLPDTHGVNFTFDDENQFAIAFESVKIKKFSLNSGVHFPILLVDIWTVAKK